jgi:hypothetical protein
MLAAQLLDSNERTVEASVLILPCSAVFLKQCSATSLVVDADQPGFIGPKPKPKKVPKDDNPITTLNNLVQELTKLKYSFRRRYHKLTPTDICCTVHIYRGYDDFSGGA